jgi:hypothetical protein
MNYEFGRLVAIWSIELASRFKLYGPEAVIVALMIIDQIEAIE